MQASSSQIITIKTTLDRGIHQSQGGGETRVVSQRKATPRGLLNAIAELHRVRSENKQNFGNIGCGITWMEIDGERIDDYDLDDIVGDDDPSAFAPQTHTQKARQFIDRMSRS